MEISQKALLIYKMLSLPGIGAGTVRKNIRNNNFDLYNNYNFPIEITNKCNEMQMNCQKENVYAICPYDEGYPELLKLIEDFPPLLFVKGNLNLLHCNSIAVVGTRHPSPYGLEVAQRIAMRIASNQIVVTSGLALGIDASAHKGAILANGLTIAVLAHGLDSIAPKTNNKLADEIIDNGGTLISEHEIGVKPIPAFFALRDRIQSGISIASIIIESGVPGGSIIQAKYTFAQKRKLFVIVRDPESKLSNELNLQGAEYLINNFAAEPVMNISELTNKVILKAYQEIKKYNQKELFT